MNNPIKINELLDLLSVARERSDLANLKAFELRQLAIRSSFQTTSAIDHAVLLAEIFKENIDKNLHHQLIHYSREAALKAAKATLVALEAMETANEADKKVTEAFTFTKNAAEKLADALNNAGYK